MDETTYSGRKSRIFHQEVGKTPEWRSVGSITIVSPELDKPLFLDGMGYTIFFHETKDNTLRDVMIVLERLSRTDQWKFRFWLFFTAVLGIALMRAWYSLFAF